ncbi:hypothetical protein HKX48_007087 [Thoreauomyces humboldtii]|nr:hypothetical protein HKX48_007087 [Thoreauomyces humboldtii]
MARGAQKEQSRLKAQKLADAKKGGVSQLKARAAGLTMMCPACKSQMASYKILAQHMEAKHPKDAVPTEESFAAK